MLKVSSFRSNARTKMFTPLNNYFVDDAIGFCNSFGPEKWYNLDIYITQGSVATYIRCGG